MKQPNNAEDSQFGLFDPPVQPQPCWPGGEQFPHNEDSARVESRVLADLQTSDEPLIITGFTSLSRLIADMGRLLDRPDRTVRLLLGTEPQVGRQTYTLQGNMALPQDIEQYWLDQQISLRLSAALVAMMDWLRAGRIQARYLDRLHAKLYLGETAITLGSSNYSDSGLRFQHEANARFTAATEPGRFESARQLAENFWAQGRDYNQALLALLEQLLQVVGWEDALARAAAELLEGEWAKAYLGTHDYGGEITLWESQRQGIAQALWVLDNQGSVLVADATGSGKTRMGAHLLRALLDRLWASGQRRGGPPVLVCPPAVTETWQREELNCHLALRIQSQGQLSRVSGERHEQVLAAVQQAQILAVDEAHNFLNLTSNRTRNLLHNLADHVVLFTATPINRRASDLLRLVDILGADNLDEASEKVWERLARWREGDASLSESELEALRQAIQRFTVRRTKGLLNQMIDRQPEQYRDRDGRPCRYPRHVSRLYPLDETDEDCQRARRIRDLAGQLRGLAALVSPLSLPKVMFGSLTAEQYLLGRLKSARHLMAYQVMAYLRSSRAALYEHLRGTAAAQKHYHLPEVAKSGDTGNLIARLEERAGQPPENHLDILVPDWLSDPEAHRLACREEIDLYREILAELLGLSEAREEAKARHLSQLLIRHHLVLAFDRRPITLADLQRRLKSRIPEDTEILVATGSGQPRSRRQVKEALSRGSARRNLIALCSDSLSEGLNLQQTSAIVHLDVPSVLRIAEQRVGRVDRMDSPHPTIEAWWPDDAPAFQLRSDETFIERYQTVEVLLGSNLPLPEAWHSTPHATLSTRQLIERLEQERQHGEWDGLQDAFVPVRRLVEGEATLIDSQAYDWYRQREVRVLARVSLVSSTRPWAFFCIAGDQVSAPKWVLFENPGAAPLTDLQTLCERLRELLPQPSQSSSLPLDEVAQRQLSHFLDRLEQAERTLLPRRKRKALGELERLLPDYRKRARQQGQLKAAGFCQQLLDLLQGRQPDVHPDWQTLADRWLELIRPVWFRRLRHWRRNKPLRLQDLHPDLLHDPEMLDRLQAVFADIPSTRPFEVRIAACILGTERRN